jgi:putative methyltransferase (TIGR04325 family)
MKVILRSIFRNLRDFYQAYLFSTKDGYSLFKGVYETFEQAIEAVPTNKSIGYDNETLAQEYQDELKVSIEVRTYDYPILFWLKSIFSQDTLTLEIFDFGGNVGIHFYSYLNYLNYPSDLVWRVCEVPAIAQAGKELAERRACYNLEFTCCFDEASGADIFLASGSIQYVKSLAESIQNLSKKPSHLLFNRLPLHNREDQFVTLQNGGQVFYPQYVFNKAQFIESFSSLGYELIDIWEDKEEGCIIPFHSKKSLPFYNGLYLRLRLD